MSEYYFLECTGSMPGMKALVVGSGSTEDGWLTGARFTGPVETPIPCEVITAGEMVTMFTGGILLMRDKLVETLQHAGVDNLDVYDAVIRRPKTGETWTNYKAVNIIGTVSVVDMARSETDRPEGDLIDVPFEGVTLDDTRARGMLMFRLAEAVAGIVVHQRVKDALAGFPELRFVAPEEWVG